MLGYDVAVIGAGVFGSWSAWRLRRENRRVLLVDAWGAGHSRSSSGGESRIIRMGYGSDAIYTGMARRSLVLWKELFARIGQPQSAGDKIARTTSSSFTGQPLFQKTGVLWIGSEDDPYTLATRDTLSRAGVPMEILSAAEIGSRYPQMRVPKPKALGILEAESGALMARQGVAAVVREAIANGVEHIIASVEAPTAGGRVTSLKTSGGEWIHASEFVFACGPWLPKLFPSLLGKRIYPTRQEVFFVAPPAGDRRFAAPLLPVWIDFTDPRGPYGFPDLESRGVKLAFDRHGDAFDPDSGDRTVSRESIAQAREFLAERFPALRDAPLTETRVCQYENTSNGDFLIDRHPDFENVWLVGGGSGHGFKHGPALGEYVASQMMHSGPAEPRFSLASKAETQKRTVF